MSEFDPQRFHLDEDAAATSIFKGLVASGWQTAAVATRLGWPAFAKVGELEMVNVCAFHPETGIAGKKFVVVEGRRIG